MRLGTWNLAGRWSNDHREFLESLQCDVLLLTEVSDRVELPGMTGHVTNAQMARRRHWAGICSTHPLTPLADPHGASAMAEVLGQRFCSSILPWKGCGSGGPWAGANTAERTIKAVDAIAKAAPTVWGGDWNHALQGCEHAGSKTGRDHLLKALAGLGLSAATTDAPHQIEGLLSIDHIAVPTRWSAGVEHHSARFDEGRLSDHDAYVVETDRP
ncbi:endonuclease/exonuclease/phosphatase family protein [Nocardioides sp. URHA0020]|uniref:endonuclease/exonuclease/phosphatase family protein n=1 Tax=Nocardioides sp. URHA0020 TaxID=1380392 RepID=UPI0018CC3B18|nr:endonuclease/exonuclease/phosphatase family protein [Nocardioides sp. URHA0020]